MGWPTDLTWYKLLTDWGSLIGGIFALLAGAALYVIGRVQVRATKEAADKQIAAIKFSLQAETMLKLMDKFDSEAFRMKRTAAVKACLFHLEGKNPGTEVEDVLDFFEDIAFLVKRGALDIEMMWHLYHWVRMYMQAAEQHMKASAKGNPAIWDCLRWAYPRLNELEKTVGHRNYTERIDDAEIRAQLQDEIMDRDPREPADI